MEEQGRNFEALSTTISSIYDLRGIGVTAVYVSADLWCWMRVAEDRKNRRHGCWLCGEQSYNETGAKFKVTPSGVERATIKPYGADHDIPVKPKYSGKQPWKIVVALRDE